MDHHLRVCLGIKAETCINEIGAQIRVVFNDAVMNERHIVAGDMGMSVDLAGRAVGGPAGMGNADETTQRLLVQGVLQRLNLAQAAHPVEMIVDQHGESGGIVTPVFQPS